MMSKCCEFGTVGCADSRLIEQAQCPVGDKLAKLRCISTILPTGWRRPTASQHHRNRSAICRRQSGCRSEEHTSELQSRQYLVCRLLLEKKKKQKKTSHPFNYPETNSHNHPHCSHSNESAIQEEIEVETASIQKPCTISHTYVSTAAQTD